MYTRFYDQVLTEISGGEIHAGINLLVGMLDTVGLQAGSLSQARDELRGHSLGQMLRQDPLCVGADALPEDASARIRMIADRQAGDDVSSTGRRLFAATSDLTLSRALRGRQHSFDRRLERAGQRGETLCLLTDEAETEMRALVLSGSRFDHILAPVLADRCAAEELARLLGLLRPCLSPGGSIVLAALHPHHIGAGWRQACLNWDPECHDEQALERAAAAAGLSAKTYRDETDCVVWGELRLAQNSTSKGGTSHGN